MTLNNSSELGKIKEERRIQNKLAGCCAKSVYMTSVHSVECFTLFCLGLSMTMDIQQHEYLKQTGDTAGAVVVIGPQNQMPFPEDDGIIVSPGHATSIAITQVCPEH